MSKTEETTNSSIVEYAQLSVSEELFIPSESGDGKIRKDANGKLRIDDVALISESEKGVAGGVATYEQIEPVNNKVFDAVEFSGLGRANLVKNFVSGVNILTQSMISIANYIYIIQYDYDLNGATIIIPANVTLKFDGGSLRNGNIVGNLTRIDASIYHILYNVEISGTWKIGQAYPEWCGAKADGVTDDLPSCNAILNFKCSEVVFTEGVYGISDTLYIQNSNITIKRKATIKALAAMEYVLVGDYPIPGSSIDLITLPIITGGGTIDANGLAGVAFASKGGRRACISELQIKNPLSYCIKASVEDGVSGSIFASKLVLTNSMEITTSKGIYANRTDSTWSEITMIDFKTGIVNTAGNNKFLDLHPWILTSSFWQDSVAFDNISSDGSYIACEADTLRTFIKLHVDYSNITILHGIHYKNDVVVSNSLATTYPPVSIDKNETQFSQLTILGGSYFFNIPYKILSARSHLDYVNIMRRNDAQAANPNTSSMRMPSMYYTQPAAFTSGLTSQDKGLMVLNSEWVYPNIWSGSNWIDSDGIQTTLRKFGTTVNRPGSYTSSNMGARYFDTNLLRWISWDGTRWLDFDGAQCDALRNGTFASKPIATDIYIGFRYFCIDLLGPIGSLGADIIHKGSDIWVNETGVQITQASPTIRNIVMEWNTSALVPEAITKDWLNTAYPNAKRGFVVILPNLAAAFGINAMKLEDVSTGNWIFSTIGVNSSRTYAKTESDARYIQRRTGIPTATSGIGAGTASSVTLVNANDTAGTVIVLTGTAPAGATIIATLTFSTPYGTIPHAVILTPSNSDAAALHGANMVYIPRTGISTTKFDIASGTSGLAASTTYEWSYHVVY